MSKSQDKARHKQVAIVAAAFDLFLERGYAATSMDEVASVAGVTKQTVYRYFTSKSTLFAAVLTKIRTDERQSYVFQGGTPETELKGFGYDLLAFHLTPAALGIYRLILREGGQQQDLLDTFTQSGPDRVTQLLSKFLLQHFPRLNDASWYAQTFISMVLVPRNQLVVRSQRRMSRAQQAIHVDKVVKLFLNGLPSSNA